jgi:thioredoxin 1
MEIKFTDDNYNEYFSQDRLVVIDFWATWCGPCQRLAPVIAQIAEEYEGKVFVGKCNAENNEELVDRFGIRNIPTILFVKNGEAVNRISGIVNAAKIREEIDKITNYE